MARPLKKGLDFYKKDIGFYEDLKIYDLLDRYGPLGVTVYDIVLTMIYREGYYIEAPIENVARNVLRIIGNRWAKKEQIVQVIRYCSELDLFHRDFLQQNVITSVSIQRRYNEVASRNRIDKSRYWLLDEQPCEDQPDGRVSATETSVIATETSVIATEITTKNKNKNKSKNKNSADASYDLDLFTERSLTKPPVYRKKGEK